MKDPEQPRRAIPDLHGLEGRHARTAPVHDVFRGETMWEGEVEEFAVTGHPGATVIAKSRKG